MNIKTLLLVIAMFIVDKSIAQINYILNDRDSIEFFYAYEEDTLVQINYGFYKPRFRRERQRLLYRNGTALDSAGNRFRSKPSFRGSTLIGYGYKDGLTQIINCPIEGNLNIQTDDRLISYTSNYPLALRKNGDYLPTEIIKIQNDSFERIINLEKYLGYEDPPGLPEEVLSILSLDGDGQIIAETAYCDGGCYSYRYFVIQNKIAEELPFNYLKTNVQTRSAKEEEDFRVNFYFSQYDYDFLMAAVDYGNLTEDTDLIFSKDLKDTTHIIKKHQPWEIMGENIQEGKNQFFYLRSRLDNGEKVIVSYKVDRAFEEVAYDIFKNYAINKSQIKDFNEDQLGILKNLVFAKYNYTFSTDFYQAYFNLFEFYNDEKMRASRTKDMNGLLTEVDTKNLEVINKALKKFEN
jgi:hypothetical protein